MNGEEGQESKFYGRPETFKDVVISHLKKIAGLSATEFRGGYYITFTDRKGVTKESYVEDSRERYNNSVLILSFLLKGKFDDNMEKRNKEIHKELEELRKKFLKTSSINENEILGEGFYEKDEDKVLLEEYKTKKLRTYHKLFSELCLLLGRLNYMEIGGGEY